MDNPNKNGILQSIGKRIKEIRNEAPQDVFALELDTIKQTISKYEHGKIMPGGEFLLKLYKVKRININWLLTGEGEMYILNDYNQVADKSEQKYKT